VFHLLEEVEVVIAEQPGVGGTWRRGLLRPRERRGCQAGESVPPSSLVTLRRVMRGGVEELTLISYIVLFGTPHSCDSFGVERFQRAVCGRRA